MRVFVDRICGNIAVADVALLTDTVVSKGLADSMVGAEVEEGAGLVDSTQYGRKYS